MSGKANAPKLAKETEVDSWLRFERAVDAAVKTGGPISRGAPSASQAKVRAKNPKHAGKSASKKRDI